MGTMQRILYYRQENQRQNRFDAMTVALSNGGSPSNIMTFVLVSDGRRICMIGLLFENRYGAVMKDTAHIVSLCTMNTKPMAQAQWNLNFPINIRGRAQNPSIIFSKLLRAPSIKTFQFN